MVTYVALVVALEVTFLVAQLSNERTAPRLSTWTGTIVLGAEVEPQQRTRGR